MLTYDCAVIEGFGNVKGGRLTGCTERPSNKFVGWCPLPLPYSKQQHVSTPVIHIIYSIAIPTPFPVT